MKLFACLTMAGLALACGDGGRAGPTRYPDDPSMALSQSIGPNGVGKSRLVTTPAVGSDGTIYVGGADPSAPVPPVACLYAFNADGSRKQRLCGSDGDHRGAPAIWVATTADGLGAYAVDEAGGLYTMRADGTNRIHDAARRASVGAAPDSHGSPHGDGGRTRLRRRIPRDLRPRHRRRARTGEMELPHQPNHEPEEPGVPRGSWS